MRRPKIKDQHNPIRLPDGRIRIGGAHFGLATELGDEDGVTWTLLSLLDGSRTVDEVVAEIGRERPKFESASVREAIEALVASGFVEDAAADPPPDITPRDMDRYARGTNFYSWIDLSPRATPWEIQSRLKAARVTILGLGGAGSAVAMSLAASGVGNIHCADFDVIERSSLNRQLLYTESDIGRNKVETAVERLSAINPDIGVTGSEAQVDDKDDLVELMSDQDMFFLCADRPDPRSLLLWSSDAAMQTSTPWISCFYNGPMVVIGLFVPHRVPCYRCLRHWVEESGRDADEGDMLLTVDANAVIAPSASMTGHLAAWEAINYLGDLRPQTVGKLFHFNLLAYDHFYFVEPPFWADCPACGAGATTSQPLAARDA